MGLFNTLRFILGHPLNRTNRVDSLRRFAHWQIRSRLANGPVEVEFAGGTKLLVSRGQTGATGNIYAGLHELAEMSFVLHLLRPGDLFIDVGANIGSYTVLAAGAVGARSVAFEPDPETANALRTNVAINRATAIVDVLASAVGAEVGTVRFTAGLDTLNHVATGGSNGESIEVPVTTLDVALKGKAPTLLKVDVEGYETDVINGATMVLESDSLLAVIMETNGTGARYSASDDDLHARILGLGFSPCDYDPFARELTKRDERARNGNTIYVRDITVASARVKTSRSYDIAGRNTL